MVNNQEVNEDFSDLIRNRLSDKQFWKWASRWVNADDLCDQAENWDEETKEEAIIKIKEDIL